jgi:hypothetical protein
MIDISPHPLGKEQEKKGGYGMSLHRSVSPAVLKMGANGKCAVGERGKVWETRKWQCMAIT